MYFLYYQKKKPQKTRKTGVCLRYPNSLVTDVPFSTGQDRLYHVIEGLVGHSLFLWVGLIFIHSLSYCLQERCQQLEDTHL